jgi:hypothetical protein
MRSFCDNRVSRSLCLGGYRMVRPSPLDPMAPIWAFLPMHSLLARSPLPQFPSSASTRRSSYLEDLSLIRRECHYRGAVPLIGLFTYVRTNLTDAQPLEELGHRHTDTEPGLDVVLEVHGH